MTRIEDPEDPILQRLHADRLLKRDIDQLLGICEFALQDGIIDQAEAKNILAWLENHRACLDTWPANILYDRLRTMLRDGILDEDEQSDLLGTILAIAKPRTESGHNLPTSLPLDTPPPAIVFTERSFCFTGVFDFGSRNDCHTAIESRGGLPAKGITKKLNYLVIGNIGSDSWLHSSFGHKIAKAIEYRDDGVPLFIISEAHWATSLG